MNNLSNFAEEVKAQIVKLNTDIDIKDIDIRSIVKTNDTRLTGLVISENGRNISPTIYLDEYYPKWRAGLLTIQDVAKKVIKEYKENRMNTDFNTDSFTNFENAKERIVFRILNHDLNKELLSDVPHIPYMDLDIVFCYLVPTNDFDSTASILIHYSHIKSWGVTTEDLYAIAMENTPKLLPPSFDTLDAVITRLMGFNPYDNCEDKVPMYVLTNERTTNGAGVILYDGLLEKIANQFDSDFYILPSSIHEVLIVPSSVPISKSTLDKMVTDVNTTEVAANEILSDHAYYYSRNDKKVIAA
jgi:hypothetical protein